MLPPVGGYHRHGPEAPGRHWPCGDSRWAPPHCRLGLEAGSGLVLGAGPGEPALAAGLGAGLWAGYRAPCSPASPLAVGCAGSPLGAQQKGTSIEIPQFIPCLGVARQAARQNPVAPLELCIVPV